MAQLDRFMIAPLENGQQSNVKSWLIPDQAFAQLSNAYAWRGRIKKRFGSQLLEGSTVPTVGYEQLESRLRLSVYDNQSPTPVLAQTDALGNYGPTILNSSYMPYAIGQAFSIGNEIITIYDIAGTVAKLITTGSATVTLNVSTGTLDVIGATPLQQIYFYPGLPVMGFVNYQNGQLNNEPCYAFDTKFAYQFAGTTGWDLLGPAYNASGSMVWTGSNSQFFWGTTWNGADNFNNILFVSNFNKPDNIAYWNNAVWGSLNPAYNAGGQTILTARIVLPFKDRLILLNTIEQTPLSLDQQYFNRCRFSQNGSPFDADAWKEDIPGRGGYIDCPVKEQIITAQFLRDHLIVFFENSTWELVYTQNQILPFVWQQINTELGAESTFSEVPFDQQVFGIGDVGIHECHGSQVNRIDMLIPDEVFSISNNNTGPARVAGIRDYFSEMVYWSYPYKSKQVPSSSDIFPNRVFVYNYKNQSWSFNDDSITAFGYFAQKTDRTWASMKTSWQEESKAWNSPTLNIEFRQIIAGNQEGYTFICDTNANNNATVLQITDIYYSEFPTIATFTVKNHNLKAGAYITINSIQYTGSSGPTSPLHPVYVVDTVIDYDTFYITLNASDFAFAEIHSIKKSVVIGTTDLMGSLHTNLTAFFSAPYIIGQYFVVGTETFTITQLGSGVALSASGTGNGTIDTTTGDITINSPANPSLPVTMFTLATEYLGGGVIALVTPIDIWTKQYNFYAQDGKNAFIPKIDFMVDKTSAGALTIDYYTSTSSFSLVQEGESSGAIVGTNILETSPYTLYPYEASQERLWHTIYTQATGEVIQMHFYLTQDQALDANIPFSPFQLHAFTIYAQAVGRLQ